MRLFRSKKKKKQEEEEENSSNSNSEKQSPYGFDNDSSSDFSDDERKPMLDKHDKSKLQSNVHDSNELFTSEEININEKVKEYIGDDEDEREGEGEFLGEEEEEGEEEEVIPRRLIKKKISIGIMYIIIGVVYWVHSYIKVFFGLVFVADFPNNKNYVVMFESIGAAVGWTLIAILCFLCAFMKRLGLSLCFSLIVCYKFFFSEYLLFSKIGCLTFLSFAYCWRVVILLFSEFSDILILNWYILVLDMIELAASFITMFTFPTVVVCIIYQSLTYIRKK